MIHYARWDAVVEARDFQKTGLREYFDALKDPKFSDQTKRELKAYPPAFVEGTTWEDAYEAAAKMLKGTAAFGRPATMKNSYLKVQKDFKDPSKAYRYSIMSHRTLKLLGANFEPPRRRRRK